ncbi:MAG: hypothetical protein HOW73_34500 [Polyangiaceae bacterium]|nr:hypothetical protein [Polyangiaceae bacterium]
MATLESPIAITGMGAVSALGTSCDAMWAAIERGENGIRPVTRYSTEGLGSDLAGMLADTSAFAPPLAVTFAIAAGREALAHARIDPGAATIGLVLGSSLASARADLAKIGDAVGDALGLRGPRIVISTACSSSTHAVGLARDLVRAGHCDAVLAGGTDELTPEIFAGFSALGVVSREPCAPFSTPTGTTLGEGAGLVVVETAGRAIERGASPVAFVRGYALSSDAHHATSPDPNGAGVGRALRAALSDAAMEPAEIDYVNAHGTGTEANDPAEYRAIVTTFEGAPKLPLVSSSKSFLGHAQGAAGILELIVTLISMGRGVTPHTASFRGPRPRCPDDPVAGERPRKVGFERTIATSSAFGGANACVVVERSPSLTPKRSPRTIHVVGASIVGPNAIGLEEAARGAKLSGRAEIDIARAVKGVDPRGLDTTTKLLAAATKRALDAAGLTLRGDARARVGLFVGQTHVSPAADREFHRSIAERSLARLNATAFAKMVLNAAAGAVTRMFDLRGASTAISTGASSGAAVVALGADYLASHGELDALVVAGVHELVGDEPEAATEGASALVLSATPPERPAVALEAWAFGATGDAARCADRVVRASGDKDDEPTRLDAATIAAGSGGFSGAAACAIAAQRALQGGVHVVTDERGTLSVGLRFGRSG